LHDSLSGHANMRAPAWRSENLHADDTGASSLTTVAELRLLPLLFIPPLVQEDRRAALRFAPHG
jgi:hypothetical protein